MILPFIHVLCQQNLHSLESAHLKSNIYDLGLPNCLKSMALPRSFMVLPSYAKSVAQMMVESMTSAPYYRCKQIAHHPYINDKSEDCNNLINLVLFMTSLWLIVCGVVLIVHVY